jgi:hypothetical protein
VSDWRSIYRRVNRLAREATQGRRDSKVALTRRVLRLGRLVCEKKARSKRVCTRQEGDGISCRA